MAKKKAQHGGKREGAGRKPGPDGPAVTMAVSVPESLLERLDAPGNGTGVVPLCCR
jgi:hypothetical protein